jgi:hypothetical protein
MHFQQYDAIFIKREGSPIAHLPKHLVQAVLTAFTLQLVSLFDEGLTEAWQRDKPGTIPPMLGVKVAEFVRLKKFKDPEAVRQLVLKRNDLAHKSEAFATWDDWDATYRLVQRELAHLGIVYPPSATEP